MKKPLLLVLVALSVLAAACGGGDGATATTAGDGTATTGAATGGTVGIDPNNPTINLAVNPWTASLLNVEIAKQLIESHLGYPVEAVAIDENAAMFTGMADGTVDAVLELWPSGITDDEQAFLDEGSVVEIGELGAVGKIGWFVPQYVIDEHPDLATWEGFQDPANAALFATAETGDQGRFLGTDPSYSQYDEAIISNLDLPFQVVFSGSEAATVAELDARVAAQEPIVMYWWTPTAAVAKYNLVNVPLPEYSEECYADPAAIDCDYPEDVLLKVASAQLEEKAPPVWEFLNNFTITTEDQLSMLPAAEIDGEDISVVAKEWIDTHQDVWQAWLP
ncbi:MAG TPA: ABC transporter substrate-binding protein [Acidimicrobiia bacterium]|nr:ABC transporter substrate-binding protein [Acidimicrobiia bacterium]HJR86985.1 ABC transporter substrate-binding protein [Acidimicrobiia bacterium]